MTLTSRGRGGLEMTRTVATGCSSDHENAAIEVSHLRKTYGSTVAVDDVSFSVREDEIFGILGPNGAGKTTTALTLVGGVRLHLDLFRGHPEAWFEASLPRWLANHNLRTLSVSEAHLAIQEIYNSASRLVEWACDPEHLQLSRLDTVRDFRRVDYINEVISAYRDMSVPWGAESRDWGNDQGYTSVCYRKPKRWKGQLYNKAEEVVSRAKKAQGSEREALYRHAEDAKGVLRFELAARRPVLRARGITQVADLTQEVASRLNRSYFERIGFDKEIGGVNKVKAAAIYADEEDYKQFPNVLALLSMEKLGLPIPWSHNTISKYRKLANTLALSASDLSDTERPSVRLDYNAGKVQMGSDG